MQTRSETRVNPKMNNLEASFNPEASKIVVEAKSGNVSFPMSESSAMTLSVIIELVEPRTFQEAWNHTHAEECMN